jgi:ketosteroid isomerase-like protein
LKPPTNLEELLDREAIFHTVRMERVARDQDDWVALAASYTDDAIVRVTWFEGTAQQFADASAEMIERGVGGWHQCWPLWAEVDGDRALCESKGAIFGRDTLRGVEVDTLHWCRWFSRLRRTEGGWRLASFDAIYGNDTMTPTNPADQLPVDDWDLVADLRPSYRWLAYSLISRGYRIDPELPGDDRRDLVDAFYAASRHWLRTGELTAPLPGASG